MYGLFHIFADMEHQDADMRYESEPLKQSVFAILVAVAGIVAMAVIYSIVR